MIGLHCHNKWMIWYSNLVNAQQSTFRRSKNFDFTLEILHIFLQHRSLLCVEKVNNFIWSTHCSPFEQYYGPSPGGLSWKFKEKITSKSSHLHMYVKIRNHKIGITIFLHQNLWKVTSQMLDSIDWTNSAIYTIPHNSNYFALLRQLIFFHLM